MSYQKAINYLYSLQKFGLKFGLKNTEALLDAMSRPERDFPTLHVAGTNGKGSTSAMIATLLSSCGLRTGLFTSPHMVRFTERIKILNPEGEGKIKIEEITEEEVTGLTELIQSKIPEGINPTFFEFVTVMAFKYFSQKKVDAAVIEVGMGGRLDATNVITPLVSVITKIGFDHREFLGETLREISEEKAGIIKKGIPVVSHGQDMEAMEVIKRKAMEMNSSLYIYGEDFRGYLKEMTPEGITFDYEDLGDHGRLKRAFKNLFTPLTGTHQLENASVAIKAFLLFLEQKKGSLISSIHGEEGEKTALLLRYCSGIKNTFWPGRLELIRKEGIHYLLDGAHNPQAAERLAESIKNLYRKFYNRIILITGIMGDKDAHGIIKPLKEVADIIIVTRPDYERAMPVERLKEFVLQHGKNPRTCFSVEEAIAEARNLYRKGDLIVITGSFYTVGEAKVVLGERESLRTLRESVISDL